MILHDLLATAISKTEANPVVQWNDATWSTLVEDNDDGQFSKYLKNEPMPDSNKRCHGYYALLHNIVSGLPKDAGICELGNRRGLSTICILDAMELSHRFITVDTVQDLRMLPIEKANELTRVGIFMPLIGDCLEYENVSAVERFLDRPIDLLFCDTIHTYEQVSREFTAYESLLADEAIILVDDIRDWGEHLKPSPGELTHPDQRTKYRFFEEWGGVKYDITELCHNPTGFAAFLYERNNENNSTASV